MSNIEHTMVTDHPEIRDMSLFIPVRKDFDRVGGDLTPQDVKYLSQILVFNPDGDILALQKKCSNDVFKADLPGGEVEPGQSFLDAAFRELEEETTLVHASLNYA